MNKENKDNPTMKQLQKENADLKGKMRARRSIHRQRLMIMPKNKDKSRNEQKNHANAINEADEFVRRRCDERDKPRKLGKYCKVCNRTYHKDLLCEHLDKNSTINQVLEDIAKHGSWQRVEYWFDKYGVKHGK